MTSVASAANIQLKMVYVGKFDAKEETQRMATAIAKENLSYVLPNYTSFWLFWERLESMRLYSKSEHCKAVENHEFINELTTLLCDDCDNEEWAMIFRGEADRFTGDNGPDILRALEMFKNWEEDVVLNGFETALQKYLEKLPSTPQHDNRLMIPHLEGLDAYVVVCSECGCKMKKYVVFSCNKEYPTQH
ncbi:hypothetical protein L6164_033182 [Bauhinia variegata]|uniref:Uncharacterized protein n=1 Tax=Bauhinia variegata TaxID=167791 RepID=A0ACB9KR44_BAUVA|nr:hypothetical protein L6164_033182 [Bauhinia variegata]